jgi:PBP1b-binding outer membrane lipoprotein LpoB
MDKMFWKIGSGMKFYTLLLLSAVLLGGCGVKPAAVDAPGDVEEDTFPRTYPDLATDPAPQAHKEFTK